MARDKQRQESSLHMEQNEESAKQLSTKHKLCIMLGTLSGLGVGGALGVIMYYQHWLG